MPKPITVYKSDNLFYALFKRLISYNLSNEKAGTWHRPFYVSGWKSYEIDVR